VMCTVYVGRDGLQWWAVGVAISNLQFLLLGLVEVSKLGCFLLRQAAVT
jgi:hypothetical protein